MKVLKFGGTSVGSPDRMKKLLDIINPAEQQIVVLSAVSGTTNSLVEIGQAYLAGDNRHTTTAGSRRSRRLFFLRSALFRAECRRPDLRARGSARSLSPQKLGRIARCSRRPVSPPRGALDDQAHLRPLVGLRSTVRIAPP